MPTSPKKNGANLSRARQQFELLLAKVAQARRAHADWAASARRLRELGRRELDPILEQFNIYARQLIEVFDRSYSHSALNEAERVALAHSICVLADRILSRGDDGEVSQLYSRYHGSDYDKRRSRFGPPVFELGDMLLCDTYPVACSWDEEAEQEEAEELHAKLVGLILTLPAEQQEALLEQANAGYVDADPVTLRMLEVELEQLLRPGAARFGVKKIERQINVIEDYLIDIEFDTVGIQFSLMLELNLPRSAQLTELLARQCVRLQKHALEQQLEDIVCDLADFRDISKLKSWIRETQQHAEQGMPVHH